MDAIDCIMSRRSIRKYTGDPVSEEDAERLMRAAMAAPSAGNQQPWHFVLLTERSSREAVAGMTPYARMLPDAGLGIVVCGDTRELKHPMWEQDCSAAIQNILLAAHALGLGAVWLGFWPEMERVEPLAEYLGLPEGVIPISVLSVGSPAEQKPPAERYDPGRVRANRW
jgi:nitroreductase